MPPTASFDVTTGVDLQEVDNAINQASKDVGQRYDFKDAKIEIDFKRAERRNSAAHKVSILRGAEREGKGHLNHRSG